MYKCSNSSYDDNNRQCESCGLVFANKNGLDKHVGRNKQYNCGRLALLAKKKKQIAERTLRRDTISKLKIRKIQPEQVKPHK